MKKILDIDGSNMSPCDWEYIYKYTAGYDDCGSGPGSTVPNTIELVKWLKNCIIKNRIKTILDIGCGDMQWFPEVFKKLNRDISYTGVDCSEFIIQKHKVTFPHHSFVVDDVYSDSFFKNNINSYDLVICKDVIQHRVNEIEQLTYNLNKIQSKIKVIIYPEWLAGTVEPNIKMYTWVHMYKGDEYKNISIVQN